MIVVAEPIAPDGAEAGKSVFTAPTVTFQGYIILVKVSAMFKEVWGAQGLAGWPRFADV